MRTILSLLLLSSISLIAQQGRGGGQAAPPPPGPPKNLKILPADTNIQQVMGTFRTALGVQCTYCHVAGDFASDDNAKKGIARNMLRIVADINASFPDAGSPDVNPANTKRHVTCYTCHRGDAVPKTEAPAPGAAKPAAPPA